MPASRTESAYSKSLRDPRWQKKRLEILQARGWKCEECGDKTKELQVHHGYYDRMLKPWEYEDSTMRVMCETCHDSWHLLKLDIDVLTAVATVKELEVLGSVLSQASTKDLMCLEDIMYFRHDERLDVMEMAKSIALALHDEWRRGCDSGIASLGKVK
jgi:hypothetical protein